MGTTVEQIAAGYLHSCALTSAGNVRCWGDSYYGQAGYPGTDFVAEDAVAAAGDVAVGGSVQQVVTGSDFSCALLTNGAVRCWGIGNLGQLGYGNTNNIGDTETPATQGNVNLGGEAVQITAGRVHICALLTTGNIRCWGWGDAGRLGYGNETNVGDTMSLLPSAAGDVDVGGPVKQVVAGGSHTCALLVSGGVRCWGRGNSGQLGYGNTNDIGDTEVPSTMLEVVIQ